MQLAAFDIIGILLFAAIAATIYKTAWFYSFYSFFKFLIVIIISAALGIIISGANKYSLPVTNLQLSLIIQGISFLILWKILSFKKLFFAATDSVISINRFMFVHHIDRVLNIIPAVVASFFVSFFLFTMLVSVAPVSPSLQKEIENSKIARPLSYKIYFATINAKNIGLFENVAYKLIPAFDSKSPTSSGGIKKLAVDFFVEKVNHQRESVGLAPLQASLISNPEVTPPQNPPSGGIKTFVPPTPTRAPTAAPAQNQPTPTPVRPIFITYPTPTPFIIVTTATPTPFVPPPNPIFVPAQPTATPVLQQPSNPPPAGGPSPSQNITQIEQDIFRLTNLARTQNGAAPLASSDALAAVARAHSQDMVTRNFFNHVNPDGLDPFQRMRIGGISYTTAGENIAGGPTADFIVTNWMNSPGHRANILNPAFGRLGVGVVISPSYGLMATQDFTN